MLLASYRAVTEGTFVTENNYGMTVTEKSDKAVGVAKVKDIVYDVITKQFVDKTNDKPFTDTDFRELAGTEPARQNRAGSNTLKRAALANTILDAKSEGTSDQLVAGLVQLAREPSLLGSQLEGAFYQNTTNTRGSFSPSSNTITLLKNADLSTFLHELGHAFLSMDSQLAAQVLERGATTDGEKQILTDMKTLLDWFGIEGELPDQLAAWNSMSVEEQRANHEKMAEAFEAYLFEGKAPSLDLQPIFQRFRAWLTSSHP